MGPIDMVAIVETEGIYKSAAVSCAFLLLNMKARDLSLSWYRFSGNIPGRSTEAKFILLNIMQLSYMF